MGASSINFFLANILISLLNAGVLYYVMHRLSIIFNLNTHKWLLLIIAVILGFTIISTVMYHGNNKIIDIIGTFSSWIFVLSFLFAIVLLCEQIVGKRYKINPRIIVGIIILILGIGIYFSLKTKITTYEINTDKINKDTKILLVSDIHVDHIYKDFHVKKIQKMIESEKPDFVLIAGDMMNKANSGYTDYFSILNKDTPIFAVMGNHDVMFNKEIVNQIPQNSSIQLLKNESIEINGIKIIGLIDKSIRGKATLQENLNDCNINNNNTFGILITHQPISLEKLKDYPIDLEVAGHTHHGQIFGLRKIVEIVNDYGYGRYDERGRTAIVTQGIGTRGLPFRLGTQSEMVIINLKKN